MSEEHERVTHGLKAVISRQRKLQEEALDSNSLYPMSKYSHALLYCNKLKRPEDGRGTPRETTFTRRGTEYRFASEETRPPHPPQAAAPIGSSDSGNSSPRRSKASMPCRSKTRASGYDIAHSKAITMANDRATSRLRAKVLAMG